MIKGLYETHIYVRDLEASIAFYCDLLGLSIGWENRAKGSVLLWVGEQPNQFMLGLIERPHGDVPLIHYSFRVELYDIHRGIAWLKERNSAWHNKLNTPEAIQVFAWMPAASIFFRDPDGHLLEFVAPLQEKPHPEWGDVISWDEWQSKLQESQS